jgi:hypothetical protein
VVRREEGGEEEEEELYLRLEGRKEEGPCLRLETRECGQANEKEEGFICCQERERMLSSAGLTPCLLRAGSRDLYRPLLHSAVNDTPGQDPKRCATLPPRVLTLSRLGDLRALPA